MSCSSAVFSVATQRGYQLKVLGEESRRMFIQFLRLRKATDEKRYRLGYTVVIVKANPDSVGGKVIGYVYTGYGSRPVLCCWGWW